MSGFYQRMSALLSGVNRGTFSIYRIKNRTKIVTSHSLKRYSMSGVFPTLVHIELTNICNLKCIMCPLAKMRRPKGYMDIKLYKKIITELSSSPVETIALCLFGESLLHKDFAEFLHIAKLAGLNVFLPTNGLELSEDLARAIIDNSLDLLIISYDSQDPEIYKNIRLGGDLFVLNRNIKRFLRLKGRKRLPVTVLEVLEFPDREKQTEKVRNYWKDFDVKVAMRPVHNWLGNIPEINKFSFCKEKPDRDYGICDQPWRHAVIYWDGRVGPCCNFYDGQGTFGNIGEKSLSDIWNSDIADDFRKKHIMLERRKIEDCCTCTLKSPGFLGRLGLMLLDMAMINMYLFTTDGWRD